MAIPPFDFGSRPKALRDQPIGKTKCMANEAYIQLAEGVIN